MKRYLILLLLAAAGLANAQSLHDMIAAGTTDYSVEIKIIDSSDGTPETGVEHNTSGIDLWCRRESAAVTSLTEAALAALTTAHTDGGIEHISHGVYRLDLPDSCAATGVDHFSFGGTVTGMIVIGGRVNITLETSSDIADAVRSEPCGTETGDTLGDLICNDIEDLIAATIVKESACDSATTSTCVDATLTEADDYWRQGLAIVFTSGAAAGQASCVYDFTASSDTLTFWTIQVSPGTGNYYLVQNAICASANDEAS